MSGRRTRRMEVALLGLGLLPFFADWMLKIVRWPRPFWVTYYDPELIYFHDGLGLLRAQTPGVFDRPGIPVQLLSALLAWLTRADAVTVEPFLLAGRGVAIALLAGGLLLLWKGPLRGLPPAAKVAGAWVFLLAPQALTYLGIWSPEALYLPAGALLLWALANERPDEHGSSRRTAWIAGAALGLCISLKFTFIAWIPALALFFVADRKGRAPIRRAAEALAASLVAFVVLASYMLPKSREMVAWLWRLLTRSGSYGQGPASWPSLSELGARYAHEARGSRVWLLVLTLVLLAAWMRWWRDRSARGTTQARLALFGVVAIVTTYALVFRNPLPHYLLANGVAAIPMVGFALNAGEAHRRHTASWVAVVIIGVLGARQVVVDLGQHRALIAGGPAARAAIDHLLEADGAERTSVVLYGFRVPEPSFALHTFARNAGEHGMIFERYPRHGYVDWSGAVHLPPGAHEWRYAVINASSPAAKSLRPADVLGRVNDFVVLRRSAPP